MGRLGMKYNKKKLTTLPKQPKKTTAPALHCLCVHHNSLDCQAIRHESAPSLIRLLNDGTGCKCECHRTASGAHISATVWNDRRERAKIPPKIGMNRHIQWLRDGEVEE